ncbi:hypothetical protein FB567DRAFT_440896 [Paraphoma chrysanthemicola]|uniref:Uncharacterized protein n=1 Tax=Paraphoma chrysanthemicola TaxID=798071 RepID=A0A8K0VZZ6_9PLEO|nr:hypothetical protein FB567DRAFT_440896 [Paraphoma chrysanthemicola]
MNHITKQNLSHVDPYNIWTLNTARLQHEKHILEIGLANCVTYLNALRKRQARNERLLSEDQLPPRKKRKRIQQSNRELEREIRNRQRDERAFLNNLQACNANIYIAECSPFAPTAFVPPLIDYTSSTTQCSIEETEPTEISWTGWTDDALLSPFEKRRCNPFFAADVAPDELDGSESDIIAVQDLEGPVPRIRLKEYNSLPGGPQPSRSQHCGSLLDAAAVSFQPTSKAAVRDSNMAEQYDQTFTGSDHELQAAEARRATAAAMCGKLQQLSIHSPHDDIQSPHDTLLSVSGRRCPTPKRKASADGRGRTMSL